MAKVKTILVVEDDIEFRDMLCSVFEQQGFEVIASDTATQGLVVTASQMVDAVLTDYHLPETDGLTFCRALHNQSQVSGRPLPVWVMTGSISLDPKKAIEAGARGVFKKPFR